MRVLIPPHPFLHLLLSVKAFLFLNYRMKALNYSLRKMPIYYILQTTSGPAGDGMSPEQRSITESQVLCVVWTGTYKSDMFPDLQTCDYVCGG